MFVCEPLSGATFSRSLLVDLVGLVADFRFENFI
jgi:hypothetical protein